MLPKVPSCSWESAATLPFRVDPLRTADDTSWCIRVSEQASGASDSLGFTLIAGSLARDRCTLPSDTQTSNTRCHPCLSVAAKVIAFLFLARFTFQAT